jgi:hypothetical protein
MTMHKRFDLSDEELAEIEHRIEAASSGPWFSYVVGRDCEAWTNYIEIGCCNELGSFKSIELVGGTIADQDFMAAARQDLPRLIREVRTLRARLRSRVAAETTEALEQSGVFLEVSAAPPAPGAA